MVNKHGLARYIPADIRRQVRRNAGFGCVICGKVICDYDHLDPDFSEARNHDPLRIALLCVEHHRQKTQGMLSELLVKEAVQHPYCLTRRPYQNLLLHRSKSVIVNCSSNIFVGYFAIDFMGVRILEVKPDPLGLQPYYLNAQLFNRKSKNIFSIDHSDITFTEPTWDAENIGTHLLFRSSDRKIDLDIEFNENPDRVEMTINRLHSYLKEQSLIIEDGEFKSNSSKKRILTMQNCQFINSGVNIDSNGIAVGVKWSPRIIRL